MNAETWRYRGQEIVPPSRLLSCESSFGQHPDQQPLEAVAAVVRGLGWKQANGALRDMVCRGLLLMLDRAGEIELPPVRRLIAESSVDGAPRPEAVLIDTTPLTMPLSAAAARSSSAGAAHRRRAAVQQPDGAVSLSGL